MTDNNNLQQQLWNIANTLRGKMGADEFRDYILGFIFYKYLSEKMHTYANKILEPDGIKYSDLDEKGPLIEQLLRGPATQLPRWIRGAAYGARVGGWYMLGAMATTAVLGQLGPQAIFPEEGITRYIRSIVRTTVSTTPLREESLLNLQAAVRLSLPDGDLSWLYRSL